MKSLALKVLLILSLLLNALFAVFWFNHSLKDKQNFSEGDPGAYRVFISQLGSFEHFLEEAGQQEDPNQTMNSLINGNERLKLSVVSWEEFKHSMKYTDLDVQIIDLALENIDESTFHFLSGYALNDRQLEDIEEIREKVSELLGDLPEEYTPEDKASFIKTINHMGY
ncbi:hypothetical protein M3231_10825 [Neobacillus mesonae]|nr:hypothetical protein [Neobacillus mesonae]